MGRFLYVIAIACAIAGFIVAGDASTNPSAQAGAGVLFVLAPLLARFAYASHADQHRINTVNKVG